MTLKRVLKVGVGIFLLGVAASGVVEAYKSTQTLDAVLNGRVVRVTAPVDGFLSSSSAIFGRSIPQGDVLVNFTPRSVQSGSDVAAVQAQALEAQIKDLEQVVAVLQERSALFLEGRTRQLERQISEGRSQLAVAEARMQSAMKLLDSKRRLVSAGLTANSNVLSTQMISLDVEKEVETARATLAALDVELLFAKRGTLIGNGYGDISYSDQRAIDLKIRIAELKAELARSRAVADQAIAYEDSGLGSKPVALKAPATGRVWSVAADSGQLVRAGDEVMRMIDCSKIFAIVNSSRPPGSVREGDGAEFVSDELALPLNGRVVWAGAARPEMSLLTMAALASAIPSSAGSTLVVAFEASGDLVQQCPVGLSGRITITPSRAVHDGSRGPAHAERILDFGTGGKG